MRTFIILGIIVGGCAAILVACQRTGGGSIQDEVNAAISQEQYQFIALMDDEARITYPQVPEIPEWYFKTTGIKFRTIKPETMEAEAAHMKGYNEALYQSLKSQCKFRLIEENIAAVKTNLDNYEKSKKSN